MCVWHSHAFVQEMRFFFSLILVDWFARGKEKFSVGKCFLSKGGLINVSKKVILFKSRSICGVLRGKNVQLYKKQKNPPLSIIILKQKMEDFAVWILKDSVDFQSLLFRKLNLGKMRLKNCCWSLFFPVKVSLCIEVYFRRQTSALNLREAGDNMV